MEKVMLEIKNLKKYFYKKESILKRGMTIIKAIDDISFHIEEGETLGLVGESGCGKTTLGRLILRLIDTTSGEILFQGKDLLALERRDIKRFRRDMQMVFQDPQSSLDPRKNVKNIVSEPFFIHGVARGKLLEEKVLRLLHEVGLKEEHLYRYPHEFSGGQRQRIGIARALALNPKFLILDEPTSALDVSVQAQILNLLKDLQGEHHLTYLFISHNFSVITHMSDRVAVMYLGKVVEIAGKEELFKNPLHPYTRSLLKAIPIPDPDYKKDEDVLEGEVASISNPPAGCGFHPRCSERKQLCQELMPDLINVRDRHSVSCHLVS